MHIDGHVVVGVTDIPVGVATERAAPVKDTETVGDAELYTPVATGAPFQLKAFLIVYVWPLVRPVVAKFTFTEEALEGEYTMTFARPG